MKCVSAIPSPPHPITHPPSLSLSLIAWFPVTPRPLAEEDQFSADTPSSYGRITPSLGCCPLPLSLTHVFLSCSGSCLVMRP